MAFRIDADDWNALVDRIGRGDILGARTLAARSFRHPWHSRARWDKQLEQFTVRIKPGFVNGGEVYYDGSALSDDPEIPILPGQAIAPLSVPDYFLARGVAGATGLDVDVAAEEVSVTLRESIPAAELRQLRATSLVLRVPRPALVLAVEIADSGYPELTIDFDQPEDTDPSVRVAGAFIAAETPAAGEVPPDFSDVAYDEYRIAQLWFLSPPGTDPADDIGPGWTPYSSHDLFWNVNYAWRLPEAAAFSDPLTAPGLGLGLGVADGLIGGIINELNNDQALSELFLAKREIKSQLWSV